MNVSIRNLIKKALLFVLMAFIANFSFAKENPTGSHSVSDYPNSQPIKTNFAQLVPDKPDTKKNDSAKKAPDKIVVYYFHATVRCPACDLIERNTSETLTKNFGDSLKNGRLEFKILNRDAPENAELAKRYRLEANALILSSIVDGKETEWSNYEEIWNYLMDAQAFQKHLTDWLNRALKK